MRRCSVLRPAGAHYTGAMQEPWVVVISGPPCSGKSRLAGRLAGRTGWPCLAKDPFKEVLFDSLGTGDATWSARLSQAAFELLFVAADAVLATGQDLLLEGNFRAPEHGERLGRLVAGRARLVEVACQADPGLLVSRHAARAADGSRHPGHLDALRPWDPSALVRYAPLGIKPGFVFDSGSDLGDEPLFDALAAAGVPVPRDGAWSRTGDTGR